jgi:hypothetical protein
LTSDPKTPVQGIPSTSIGTSLPSNGGAAGRSSDSPTNSYAGQKRHYSGFELWLHRITVLMFVFLCASVGVLLVILPWRPEWTDNHLLMGNPWLRAIVANGFVRGLCTGLGFLDIWIGFWEAIHYREETPLK